MNIISQIKKFSVATIIVSLIMGLLFVIFPAQCIKYASLAVGISLIAIGISGVINYVSDKSSKFSLILGIIVLITGIVVCVKYRAIISLIVILFGLFILVTGLVDLITSIKAIATLRISGWFTLALSVVTIIFGIIAITKSTQLTETVVRFIGIALLIYSALDIASYFQVKSITRDVKNALNNTGDIETNATIIDETEE